MKFLRALRVYFVPFVLQKNKGTQRTLRTTKDTTQMLNKEPNDDPPEADATKADSSNVADLIKKLYFLF